MIDKVKPHLEKKPVPEADCPHDECDGTARQFIRQKGGSKFWVCHTCDQAGRDKFLDDVKGSPVVLDYYFKIIRSDGSVLHTLTDEYGEPDFD